MPFPEALFNTDQYGKTIDEWLYPVPSGLVIRWHADKTTPTSGVGVVFIPTQAPETKPFLLTRTIGDKKTTETLLGYAERHLDRTDIKSVVELHHAMRIGMNLEATLLNRITNVETLLQRQLAITPIPQLSSPALPAVTAGRVARVLAQPQLTDTRTLAIIITPAPRSELRSIFSDNPNSIRRAVEDPPELRAHGWGVRTGGAAQFIDGNFVQAEGGLKALNLYRDGELIIAVRIDRNFLAWADKSDSTVHPLAFVEFVTNTLTFYRLVLADMHITPQTVQIEVRLGNLLKDSAGTALPAGPINNLGWTFGSKPAPAAAWSRTITVDASTYDPSRAAFRLLREVYAWFGHPEEEIPYTTGTGDERVVDISAITTIG